MDVDSKTGQVIALEPIGTPPGEMSASENASIVKQTRTRRLFSAAQLYAFVITFACTWNIAGNLYYPLMNGGPRGWLIGFIICSIGAIAQVACVAEMASIQPIAGAQYYWTYTFGPRKYRMFLTWLQGWVTWLGYVAMLASTINYMALSVNAIITFSRAENDPWLAEGWQTTLIALAFLAAVVVVNLWLFWIVPWLELIAGLLNFLLFFAVLVILWVMAPRNDVKIFTQTSDVSGWGGFESFHIGLLGAVYAYNLFESSVHMGEETKNPTKAVPQSMFWGWVTNATMGLIMIFTWGLTMPADPNVILMSAVNPSAIILNHATGSRKMAAVIMALMSIVTFVGIIGSFSSSSRLTWAWARDGGLPRYFAIVDGKTRVPMRACWLTAFLAAVLTLLNLNATAYIALAAITSLAVLGGYCSYAILLGCIIYARFQPGGLKLGQWNLGKLGMPLNIFAFIFTVWMIVWLPFPVALPVTPQNMNYSGPVFGFVMIAVISWWFLYAKKHWTGPNLRILDIVLKADEASGRK